MQNNTFEYSYSAPEQEEILRIREKYIPKEHSGLDRLRELDSRVGKRATTAALVLGTVSLLLLGLGMSCCLVWEEKMFVPGIIIGVIGIAGIALGYPVYCAVTKKEKAKIAPEIIRLTNELMK